MPYTIEGKEVIALGDATSHGGKVITASENHSYLGIPVARVGDMVECPQCKGTYPIIEGASRSFDHEKPIARHGDKVACGATLISRSAIQGVQSGFLGIRMPWESPEPDPEPKPGRGLAEEEYCKYVGVLKNSQIFRDTIKHMAEMTNKNNIEYSCWFVQDTNDSIHAVNLKTDNEELWVRPGDKPNGLLLRYIRILEAFFHLKLTINIILRNHWRIVPMFME